MHTNSLGLLHAVTKHIAYGKSFVGIDVGSSTTKIVQLGIRNSEARVETYGEISHAAYADSEPGRVARPVQSSQTDELMDILHEVDARSRLCGVAMPFSETLMNVVDLPKRDKEQMDKIIPAEAQRFIPVPIEEIMLDWYVIPEDEVDAFDAIKPKKTTEAHFQKVMIVGVNKSTAQTFTTIMSNSGLVSDFFEIEIFSSARACLHAKKAPTLILDLGASATKAAIVNEHWILLAARMIPVGGAAITGEIMRAQNSDFLAAERVKCERGLEKDGGARETIEKALSPLWPYLHQTLEQHDKKYPRPVEHILICGGGSYMPGIVELIKEKLKLSVEIMPGFERTKGPMILEETFEQDGPRYAVAVGLALRGVGR
jgi:type IV pilus assembly protein PilM